MTAGTFEALNRDSRVVVSGNGCVIRWSLEGPVLSVESPPAAEAVGLGCRNEPITYLIVAERHDAHIRESRMTDSTGRLVTEYVR